MITFDKPAGCRVLELGCGANRHPQADVAVDVRYFPGVTDFACDLSREHWPEIGSDGFEVVLSIYCLEHVSWRKTPAYLREVFRILKPGGKALFLTPNTEAQLRCVQEHGWDKIGRKTDGDFVEASRILFGDNDYEENSHKSFLSPAIVGKLFADAGFVNVVTSPYGEIQTDMVIEAYKPQDAPTDPNPTPPPPNEPQPPLMTFTGVLNDTATTTPGVVPHATVVVDQPAPHKPAKDVYNFAYFNSYQGGSFYWDHPHNEPVARKILELNPASVLELGCARGYVIKRLQDRGVRVQGLDVSAHAWLTRVTDPVNTHDLTEAPWPVGKQEFDLALSLSLLEHIPEDKLPQFMEELSRVSRRGLHGVSLEGYAPNHDPTRLTLKSLDWWKRIMPPDHEVVDVREFLLAPVGSLQLPPDYVQGDGKTKLNLGCAWTMFYGWENVDVVDAENFARNFGYRFRRHDLRQGVPWQTGVVDSIFSHHFLEHLTQEEGLRFLKDCRRVIRPDGAMRLAVPNTAVLAQNYHAGQLGKYDEMNEGCAGAKTQAGKLYSILAHEHKTFYDWETLAGVLEEAGWTAYRATFRQCDVRCAGVLAGTTEMDYGGESLFVDAIPKVG